HYRYTIWNASGPNLWLRRYAAHVPSKLDRPAMERASDALLGRHDFSAFIGRAAQQAEQCSVRTLFGADWRQRGSLLQFDCCADAFGRHMVRNMVGTLLWVGRGRLAPSDVGGVLEARDRRAAGPTAPAHGLMALQ